MFSGKIEVRRLRSSEVCLKVVNDVNALLRSQHSKAGRVDEETLTTHARKSKVVVAWSDTNHVIGMGVLIVVHAVSHTFGNVHNLVIADGFDSLVLSKRIMDELLQGVDGLDFIEAGALPDDGDKINVLETLKFKRKQKLRFRHSV